MPPLAAIVCEYAVPVAPFASSDEVVMLSAALTVSEKVLLPVANALSVTVTVNDEAPAAVGVPLSAPALESDRPAGSVPLVTANV